MPWRFDIRCITFDLDDTLWPLEPTITRAEHALYAWLEQHYPRVTKKYSLADLRERRAKLDQTRPELKHDVTAFRRIALQELADEFDYDEHLANEGLRLFRHHRNQITFFNNVLPTLEKLRKHFILGAISNGNADLESIGAQDKFDFVVMAGEVGAAKPDNRIFKHAVKVVNEHPSRLLHVGDDAAIDVIGALNAGLCAAWVNRHDKPWLEHDAPHAIIQHIAELDFLLCKK